MRPEKKERVFDNEPYCKSCRRSENFCQCTGHNSCHDLHIEWFKSDECRAGLTEIAWDAIQSALDKGNYRAGKRDELEQLFLDLEISKGIASAISKYLGGEK